MGYESKITSKGQTTVPAEVRESLRLNAGDKIAYVKTEHGYLIIPRNRPVSDLFGILSEYAIPGTSLGDYDNAIGDGISEHSDSATRKSGGPHA